MPRRRLLRTALAVGLLLATARWVPASAQSTAIGQPITVTAGVSGPASTGITAIRFVFLCRDLASPLAITTRTVEVPINGVDQVAFEVIPPNQLVTPAVPGSSCQITASLRGTSGISSGLVSIIVGGVDRTGPRTFDSIGAASTVTNILVGSVISTFVPISASTTVAALVTFPVFQLRKAVVGTEVTVGAEYAMSVECFATRTLPFVETAWNEAGYQAGDLVVVDRGFVTLTVNGTRTRVFDALAKNVVAPNLLGTAANLAGAFPPLGGRTSSERVTQAIFDALYLPMGPNASSTFALRRDGTRAVSTADVPGLTGSSSCRFAETASGGASLISSSVGGSFVPRGTGSAFVTPLSPIGSTITITNTFLGRLRVSVATSGDPGSHIATFGVRVQCPTARIDDTFILKGGQTKTYENIVAGTVCTVTEPRTDGAVLTITDNSGPAVSDGVVVIPVQVWGCGVGSIAYDASGTAVVPPTDTCLSTVMLTNTFGGRTAAATPASPLPPGAPPAGPIVSTNPADAPPLPGAPPVTMPGAPTVPVTMPGAPAIPAASVLQTPAVAAVAAGSAVAPSDAPDVTPAPATPIVANPTFTG